MPFGAATGLADFSPAGQALMSSAGNSSTALPGETEEARKRRLAALQAAQKNIAGSVGAGYGASFSPASSMMLGLGG